MIPLRFTEADADAAHAAWGCNCGPAALAAIAGITLDQMHGFVDTGFRRRGYLNPSQMFDAIERAGLRFRGMALMAGRPVLPPPNFGVARIQWEGPWTEPGWPIKARYAFTHWIAAQCVARGEWQVFDVNAMQYGGVLSSAEWRHLIVPLITASIPRASGGWHITHRIEIERAGRAP